MKRPSSPGVTGTVAALLLGIFWVASFTGEDARQEAPAQGFEPRLRRLFEDNAPGIRALAVPMNGLLKLYGEKRGAAKAVFVASSATRGGILLYTPEMQLEQADSGLEAVFTRNLAGIRAQVAGLRDRGVERVLLVPVPTKLSVLLAVDPSLRAQVGRIPVAHEEARPAAVRSFDGQRTREAYSRLVAALSGHEGVEVIALQQLFVAQAALPEGPVYGNEDTHWTSLGMNLAAREIVRAWQGTAQVSIVKIGQAADTPGDLQLMLALPDHPRFRTHAVAEDVYDLQRESPPAPCPGAAFLLGTSYSNRRGQTLAAQIEKARGCPVTDLARIGGGPLASMRPLLEGHAGQLRGAVVIWEFPFRELAEPPAFTAR
jgi:hypothetical protein